MPTSDDDELFAEIRGLADDLGLEATPYTHDEVAAEEMLEHALSSPRIRTVRPRRWRGVAASVAVAASVVGLFALNGGIDGGGDDAADGAADTAASAGRTVTPAPTSTAGRPDAFKAERKTARLDALADGTVLGFACTGCKTLDQLGNLNADADGPTVSIVLVDDVSVGDRTRATVVDAYRGEVEAGDRIEIAAPPLQLTRGLGSGQRYVWFLVDGPTRPHVAYAVYAETTRGTFVTTSMIDDGTLRAFTLDELRDALAPS